MNLTQASRIDFSATDEAKIASAGRWGQIVAVCMIVSAAVPFASSLTDGLTTASVVPAAGVGINIALGIALYMASAAFRRVAKTDDNDAGQLLAGLRYLRVYFVTVGVVIIAALCVGVAAVVFGGALPNI